MAKTKAAAPLKLNLGGGPVKIEGFTTVDLHDADVVHDLGVFPWPFEDNSVDEILASHVLEHFNREDGVRFLMECHRILKPTGYLDVAVPDMDKFITAHLTGDFSPLGGYAWTDLNAFMGGGRNEPVHAMRHQYMYCEASLAHTLEAVGFSQIWKLNHVSGLHTDAYEAISLYLRAGKAVEE